MQRRDFPPGSSELTPIVRTRVVFYALSTTAVLLVACDAKADCGTVTEPGQMRISVSVPEVAAVRVDLDIKTPEDTYIPPAAAVSVTLVRTSGEPSRASGRAPLKTGEYSFTFRGLTASTYRIDVGGNGYASLV